MSATLTVEAANNPVYAIDIVVDGNRIDSLNRKGERAVIRRDDGFTAFIQYSASGRSWEIKVRVGDGQNESCLVKTTFGGKIKLV